MTSRVILALAMLMGSAIAPVVATPVQQGLSVVGEPGVRSPVLGDPGTRSVNPHWTAAQWARADRQGSGTMDGNQPDRAEAGAGAR